MTEVLDGVRCQTTRVGPRGWWDVGRRLRWWFALRRICKVKIRYGGGTTIDMAGAFSEDGAPWVYHYAPPDNDSRPGYGGLIYDHPYDGSFEASQCPICCGNPLREAMG